MINGMMTLSGAWHKLRDDPILRFLVVSLAFYGMSTFEGPMMAIKTVNVLLAPSWGGMINGMMTLSGAWHKLRTDPILRFLVVSLAFYGMSTFEGPMMAIKRYRWRGAQRWQPEPRGWRECRRVRHQPGWTGPAQRELRPELPGQQPDHHQGAAEGL